MIKAARSEEYELREAALWTVARRIPGITSYFAYELFIELLDDINSSHRSLGIQGLRGMRSHANGSAARLLALTTDKNSNIRSLALGTINQIEPEFPGFTEATVRALSDTQTLVRHTAVRIVSQMSEATNRGCRSSRGNDN